MEIVARRAILIAIKGELAQQGEKIEQSRTIRFSTELASMIELTLPWPPSVNRYWRAVKGRVIISAEGRAYRKAVADQVLIQCCAKHYAAKMKVEIEAWRPDNRRRDLDNLLKAALDACTHAGVWEDDANIVDLRIYWAKKKGGFLRVQVEKIDAR